MKNSIQYQAGFKLPLTLSVREEVMARLMAANYDFSSIVEEEDKVARTISFYWQDKWLALKALAAFKSMRILKVKPFWRVHHEKDWSSRWKKGWKPFALTRRFQVIPLWQDSRDCPGTKTPVYLETTNAFGTGLHETTRFTAQIIESLTGKFTSFLDVGTGSGILLIVALKCGAMKPVGFDIDPAAVTVARQNLAANDLSCQVRSCDIKDFKPRRLFDLVAANLVSSDLVEFCDRLVSFVAPEGYLVVSGISLENIPRVKKAFARRGLCPVKIRQGREWSAMLFKI